MAANAGHPNLSSENSYIPPPQVVNYDIFGLFVLTDLQIDLHPKTSSCLHWSVTFSGHPHHGPLLGILIASLIGTPTSQRWCTTRSVSRKPWFLLSSAQPTTLTSKLRMRVSLLRSATNCITISHLHFRNMFFQAPHPLFNVVCCGEGPHYLHCSIGMSCPLTLVPFSTTTSKMAW